MNKITLDVCYNQLIEDGNSKITIAIVLVLFGSAYFFVRFGIDIWNILIAVLLFAFGIVLIIWQKNRNKKIRENQFYIAEDVFVKVERTKVWTHYTGRFERCTIKFSRNGIYSTRLREKSEPRDPSCDYSAVNFSKSGDKFYLIILPHDSGKTILKCFNARYYEIHNDDFDFIDGKYYPKKL